MSQLWQIVSSLKVTNSEIITQVAYTFDAGPNAVLISKDRKTAANLLQRLLFLFPPQSDADLNRYFWVLNLYRDLVFLHIIPTYASSHAIFFFIHVGHFHSYVIGDKTILKDAGIEDLKDIDALAPPPEIKENASVQRCRGDVSYFICTRPGRGPVVLADESQSLINPDTGLPKWTVEHLRSRDSSCEPLHYLL